MKRLLTTCILLFAAAFSFAQDASQPFLSLDRTGVAEFLSQHPEYDGRGTIVFIFDTGVDMGVEGLLKTSTGEVKVIDVQDFTGQGDVEFVEADIDDEDDIYFFVNEDKNWKVNGADKLSLKAKDDDYFIGVLPEKLWMNSSSGVTDINGNGTEDDSFYFVTFETTEGYWVVYFDSDYDGDVSDETPLRDYKVEQQAFSIKNESELTPLTMGLNIFPDEGKVTFHFDDGSHGTHCAGIATGYMIGGNEFNGVAPGANLISAKLGNNNYAGGATVTESMKNCFLYADKISKEQEKPVIINMSFGIGSEIEAQSDMAKFLEDLTKDNPYLYICTSNGNEGPGISTSGLPAATEAVFASGAVLTQEIGSNLYGANLEDDVILYFSSRGGEVNKPDVISPGACTSTVPNWSGWDRFWGTSMASPYSTGVMSLLLSAARVEFPDTKIPSQFLYKVVRESAVWVEGYNHVDQGGGYINVLKAYELLKKYVQKGELKKYETYSVSSFAPNQPRQSARNLYLRDASFIDEHQTFRFSVRRNNFIDKKKFYRIFDLKSDADWLVPMQKGTYLRNDQPTFVNVKIDKSKMTEPGLYNAKIKAYRAKTDILEFDMMATAVVPYEFNSSNGYKMETQKSVKQGLFNRYFIKVPAGASAMHVHLASEKGKYARVRYRLHDPDGVRIDVSPTVEAFDDVHSIDETYTDIRPGIYELVVSGHYLAKGESIYNLAVDFSGVSMSGRNLSQMRSQVTIQNNFSNALNCELSAKLLGYKKTHVVSLDGKDVHNIPFKFNENEKAKRFSVNISKEDFNKITDFAVQIFDSKGKVQVLTGLSYKSETISIRNQFEEGEQLRLELVPAFANEAGQMTIHITEYTYLKETKNLEPSVSGRNRGTLYPSIEAEVKFNIENPGLSLPEGAVYFGEFSLNNSDRDLTEAKFPITIKF